jgi:hypothetical protein
VAHLVMKQEKSPDIELIIDELVLHGFAQRDRRSLSDSIAVELTRLLSDEGLPSGFDRDTAMLHVSGREIAVSSAAGTQGIGTDIARSIYGSFSTESTPKGK